MKIVRQQAVQWLRLLLCCALLMGSWPRAANAAPVQQLNEPAPGSDLFLPTISSNFQGAGQSAQGSALLSPQQFSQVTPEIVFHHYDATGNLVASTEGGGEVVWRADVQPFGLGDASSPDYALGFDGQLQEAGLGDLGGLYHMGARLYDPVNGRFLNPDSLALTDVPVDEPQRFNRYAYGLNNPYRYGDGSGRQPVNKIALLSVNETEHILLQVINDPTASPHVRRAAIQLGGQLARARHILGLTRDLLTPAQVDQARIAMNEVRAIVTSRRVSQGAFMDSLRNVGRGLSASAKGSVYSAVIIGLLTLPAVAEAASEEQYGEATLGVARIFVPFPRDMEEFELYRSMAGFSNEYNDQVLFLLGIPEGVDIFKFGNEYFSQKIDKWFKGE